jgi:hypothetical protein
MDKTTAQQPKVQQFEPTGFQDPQTAAETSGRYYHSSDDQFEDKGGEVQQFESTGFQDPQTAAETSGSYYHSSDGK